MSIRKKILNIILVLLVISIIAGGIIVQIQILPSIKQEEKSFMIRNVKNVNSLMTEQRENLDTICADWAAWDDTLEFVKNNNLKYVESNLKIIPSKV